MASAESAAPEGTTLFIGNIAWSVTNEQLREHFAQAGSVVSAEVVVSKRTGRSRGFGFVTVADAAAEKAKALTGTTLEGRDISVSPATSTKNVGGGAEGETKPKRRPRGRRGRARGGAAAAGGEGGEGGDAAPKGAEGGEGGEAAARGGRGGRGRGGRGRRRPNRGRGRGGGEGGGDAAPKETA